MWYSTVRYLLQEIKELVLASREIIGNCITVNRPSKYLLITRSSWTSTVRPPVAGIPRTLLLSRWHRFGRCWSLYPDEFPVLFFLVLHRRTRIGESEVAPLWPESWVKLADVWRNKLRLPQMSIHRGGQQEFNFHGCPAVTNLPTTHSHPCQSAFHLYCTPYAVLLLHVISSSVPSLPLLGEKGTILFNCSHACTYCCSILQCLVPSYIFIRVYLWTKCLLIWSNVNARLLSVC